MNMKKLYNDFIKHIENMSDKDFKQSIQDAVKHTSNSHILDDIIYEDDSITSIKHITIFDMPVKSKTKKEN